ncbi:MAG: FeoB-associated Cys-rich membrane protein [Odoribacteraceae bacterium]|nr:FeoB-associated Cys-rich membrane protein [Odoribacteraceae bacterium]
MDIVSTNKRDRGTWILGLPVMTVDYQQVITYLIIALALFLVVRGIYRGVKRKGRNGCCGGCKKKSCP